MLVSHGFLVGSSIPPGVEQAKLHHQLKQGDIILTPLPKNKDDAMAVAAYCKDQQLHLCFSELLHRGSYDLCKSWGKIIDRGDFYSKQEYDNIVDAGGDYYFGRISVGEIGGVLYWPKAYTINRRVKNYECLPALATHAQAEKAYVAYCRKWLDHERRKLGKGLLLNVESSMLFKYHCMAGVDFLCLEAMPGDPHLMHAAIRGAARTYHKKWGSHIAMQCYGGCNFDELYEKRWRTSVFYAHITGADFVYPESGHYTYSNPARKQEFAFNSPQMKRVRSVIREAWQFARIHRRPDGGPKTTLGVLHGKHDGTPGLWNRYAWGQYFDDKWLEGPAERGWRLVDQFHRKQDWPKETVQGEIDFSGNPPYGQYDVVPVEADLKQLGRYSCLICLGWNTMTAEIYDKLKSYVRSGGRLVMFLPQLSTRTDRAKAMRLYKRGDFSDLFGVQIKGRFDKDMRGIKCREDSSVGSWRFPLWRTNTDPRFIGNFTPARVKVTSGTIISSWSDFYHHRSPKELLDHPMLVENSVGRGKAWLVTAWEYPADEGLERFTDDLLRVVNQGEQGSIRLLSSDRVRYAVYEDKLPGSRHKLEVIYLLNTDPDCDVLSKLQVRGRTTGSFIVKANDLRLAYCRGELVVLPEDKCVDIQSWQVNQSSDRINLFNARAQKVDVHNTGKRQRHITLNGIKHTCPAGDSITLLLKKSADPKRKDFFAKDFLVEPNVNYQHAQMPY